jgi:TldD protein
MQERFEPAASQRPAVGPWLWTRRRFLGGSVLAGAGVWTASHWVDVLASGAARAGERPALPRIDSFLGRDQVEELLRTALGGGADFAEVYGEYTVTTEVTLDESKLKTLSYGVLSGVGIRAIKDEVTGYAYADDFDMKSLREAARTAASVAQSGNPRTVASLRAGDAKPPFVLQRPMPMTRGEADKIELCRRAEQAGRSVDARIHNMRISYGDTAKRFLVANSDGVWEEDEQYVSRVALTALALDGTKRESASRRFGGAVDAEYYDTLSGEAMGRETGEAAVRLLAAAPVPAGTMPVVIAPSWGGVLVHECFGHSLEGDGIRKKTSIRATQMGQQVAAKGVNIYDDGTVPFSRGSFRVDDEGTPSRKNLVVEDGVLRGYLFDLLNAKLTGNRSTGNGRRASYRDIPIPRMTNTYIAAGTADPAAIVASVAKGFYCANFGGGSVNPADGNFSFHVTEGFLIENGKLGSPVSNATLTGNGADAMMRIEMLGHDLVIDTMTGSCGKQGQSKSVGVGQPTVKFSELTVGGRS